MAMRMDTKRTPCRSITDNVIGVRSKLPVASLIRWAQKSIVVAKIDLRIFGGSALTDDVDVPKQRSETEIAHGIPVTYVPARNTIFLAMRSPGPK